MRSFLLCCLLLFLFGCGVATSIHNQNALDDVHIGDNYEAVQERLAGLKKSESFYELGHQFDIASAKAGSVSNPLPFVFMDDVLVGFGHDFYDRFNRARNDPSVLGKMIDQMMMAPPNSTTLQDSAPGQGV